MTKVFVSSTCWDVVDLRGELEDHLRQLGLEPVMSDVPETFDGIGDSMNSIETCLVNVDACDVFVCVLSQRYGRPLAAYGRGDRSATHLEYERAMNRQPRPTILFFARDHLVAAHDAWRANKPKPTPNEAEKTDASPFTFRSYWVKETDAAGLFAMLEQHEAANTEQRPNWRSTFRTSVDLKRQLTKRLGREIAVARLSRMAEDAKLPEFAIAYYDKGIHLQNVGSVPAHNVEIFTKGERRVRFSVVAPGFNKRVDQVNIQGDLSLEIRWRHAVGFQVEETFRLLTEGRANLHARRLLETPGFYVLGPKDAMPSWEE